MVRSNRGYFVYYISIIYKQYIVKTKVLSLLCASLSCVFVKKENFGAADVKLKKDMILAGKLQFYQLQKRKNEKI